MNFARDVLEAARARAGARRGGARRVAARVELRAGGGAARRRSRRTCEAQGCRRGDVVMTLVGNRHEWVLAMVACFRQGLVALPCTEQLRPNDLELRLRVAAAAAGGVRRAQRRRARGGGLGRADADGAVGRAARRAGAAGRRARAGRPVPGHLHVRHRGRAEGGAARPALPRRPDAPGAPLARRRARATSCGAPPRRAGRSRRATRSSPRGCAAPRRSCTTPASTRTSGSSCSAASASTCCAWPRPSTA